jgi:hypothetical protein
MSLSEAELRLECIKLAHDWGKMRFREGYSGISLYDVTEKAEELRRYCAAQGTEAGTAETVKQGSAHDGPVGNADAPNQINTESSHDIR